MDYDEAAISKFLWHGFEANWSIQIQSTSICGLSNAHCNLASENAHSVWTLPSKFEAGSIRIQPGFEKTCVHGF